MQDLTNFPERINAIKTITYTVSDIVTKLLEDNPDIKIDMVDVMTVIEDYAKDDFGCGWGHDTDINEIIFQDENGEEY